MGAMSDRTLDAVPGTLDQAQAKLRALLAERDDLWQRTERAEAEKRDLADQNAELAKQKAELTKQNAQLTETKAQLEKTKDQLERAKAHAEAQVERLKKAIRDLNRRQRGPKSERLDPEQFRLTLDDLNEKLAKAEAELCEHTDETVEDKADAPGKTGTSGRRGKPKRNQGDLPKHLPRVEDVIEPEDTACPCCGGEMHVIDEECTEQVAGDNPDPGPDPGDAPADLWLSGVRGRAGAGECAGPRRLADVQHGRPPADRQVHRRPAGDPAVRDDRPAGLGFGSLHGGALDGRRGALPGAALRRAVRRGHGLGKDIRRRDAGAHFGGRPANDEAGVSLGLRPGRPGLERPRPAGGGVLLR